MKLLAFIKSLLPIFEISRIIEDLEIMREQLTGKLKEGYAQAIAMLKGPKAFKSTFGKSNQSFFENTLRPRGNLNYIEYINHVLELLAADTKIFADLVAKHFERQVSSDGISFTNANILQAVNAAGFVTDYARQLLRATLDFETQAALGTKGSSKPGMTPAELQWLDKHRDAFFECLKVFDRKPQELKAKLESVPDMVVAPDDYAQLEQMAGGVSAVDPLAVGFIPLKYNPIYRIRLQIANYQVAKYRGLQAELEAIQLRLVALRYAQDGKGNAATEDEIEKLEARVADTYFRLEKMEQDYA